MSVLMNVVSSSRSRSGDAWASCSSSRRAGSILALTVIVVSFFESVVRDHSKDHPMAVVYSGSDTLTGIRTPLCRTQLPLTPAHDLVGCWVVIAMPQPARPITHPRRAGLGLELALGALVDPLRGVTI